MIFPVGSSMCTKCRLNEGEKKKTEESLAGTTEATSDIEETLPLAMLLDEQVDKFTSSETEEDVSSVQWKHTNLNKEMEVVGYTPVKHAVENLKQVTRRVIQNLKSKYSQFIQGQTKTFVEATCSGQEDLFHEVIMKPVFASLSEDDFDKSYCAIQQDEFMNELVTAYSNSCDKVSKLQILSLVPDKYSKSSVMILLVAQNIKLKEPEKCDKL